MVYGGFKDLPRRTASGKVLWDKAFDIAKNPKYDGYQRDLALIVYTFFDKKSALLARQLTSAKSLPVVLLKMKLCKIEN